MLLHMYVLGREHLFDLDEWMDVFAAHLSRLGVGLWCLQKLIHSEGEKLQQIQL